MKITRGSLVTLAVKLYDAQNNLLEATDEPLAYLHGAGDILPRIEAALDGQHAGFRTSLLLQPHEAFGEDDAERVHLLPVSALGPQVSVGMRFEGIPGQPNDGRIYTVVDRTDTVAVLDGNHPLAGRALRFDVEVIGVEALHESDLAAAEQPVVPDFLRAADAQDAVGNDKKLH